MAFFSNLLFFFGGLLSLFSRKKDIDVGRMEAEKGILETETSVLRAQAEASAKAPRKKNQLLDLLRSGKVVLLAIFFMSACNGTAASTCLALQEWPKETQEELAAKLSTIPENSPIMDMALDWSRMRAETRACISSMR